MAADTTAGGATPRLPPQVGVWGGVSLLSDLGHETVTALLPAFLAGLGAPPAGLGAVEGVSDAVASVARPLGGWMADRLRRLKPPAVAGYLLTALSMPAAALAASWPAVAALRAIAWFGRGFRSPFRDTLLVRAVPATLRGRAFGLERALDQLGAVAAPLTVAGLLWLAFEPRRVMLMALLPGLAAVALVTVGVREQPAEALPADPAGRTRGMPQPFRRLLLGVAVFGCGDFAKTLLVLWALGPGPPTSPRIVARSVLLYALFNLVTVVAAWIGGRASDRLGRRATLVPAGLLGALGALVPVVAVPSLPAAAVALGLSGLSVGVQEAVERAWAADLAPAGRRGWAFGLLHLTNGVADLVASAGVGLLWTLSGPAVAFGAAAATMGAGSGLLAAVGEHRPGY